MPVPDTAVTVEVGSSAYKTMRGLKRDDNRLGVVTVGSSAYEMMRGLKQGQEGWQRRAIGGSSIYETMRGLKRHVVYARGSSIDKTMRGLKPARCARPSGR